MPDQFAWGNATWAMRRPVPESRTSMAAFDKARPLKVMPPATVTGAKDEERFSCQSTFPEGASKETSVGSCDTLRRGLEGSQSNCFELFFSKRQKSPTAVAPYTRLPS